MSDLVSHPRATRRYSRRRPVIGTAASRSTSIRTTPQVKPPRRIEHVALVYTLLAQSVESKVSYVVRRPLQTRGREFGRPQCAEPGERARSVQRFRCERARCRQRPRHQSSHHFGEPHCSAPTAPRAAGALYRAAGSLYRAAGVLYRAAGVLYRAAGALYRAAGALGACDRAREGRCRRPGAPTPLEHRASRARPT